MAHTTIANLAHAPVEVLLEALQERQPALNSIANSPLVISDPRNFANRALEDGATQIEIPILSPLTGGYTLQNPGNPPTVDNITSGRQVAPVFYREKAWGRDAFAKAQSGLDPIAFMVDRILNVRNDDIEATLVAILNGIFASADFASLIYDSSVNEEPVGDPGSDVPFSPTIFHRLTGLLGIKEDDLLGGIITMHTAVRTGLKIADEIDDVRDSEGSLLFQTFKGMRIVVDDRLVRAGTTDGFVYPVTIAAPQTVVWSVADQNQDGTESSSLAFDSDIPNLRKALYDRVVSLLHVNGAKFVGTGVAAGGPTDVQVATADNYETTYVNVLETRIVRTEVNAG
jgi:hypothetical protein